MLIMTSSGAAVFTVLSVVVSIGILIRLLLLAGRLVRAVENIAEKTEKSS